MGGRWVASGIVLVGLFIVLNSVSRSLYSVKCYSVSRSLYSVSGSLYSVSG